LNGTDVFVEIKGAKKNCEYVSSKRRINIGIGIMNIEKVKAKNYTRCLK
jgi:hypothetical protein